MTNAEAIEEIKSRIRTTEYVGGSYVDCVDLEALKLAIKALEAQDVPDINVGDMISREELFEELNCINLPVGNEAVDKIFSVIENMPSAQPERKNITDRQAAINASNLLRECWDVLDRYCELNDDRKRAINAAIEALELFRISEQLPSAQPEIIHCKECKYGEQDDIGRWFCRGFGCQVGDEYGNGFCSDAERK